MNRWLRSHEVFAALAILAALAAAGCGKDEPVNPTPTDGFVDGIGIITDPLAPAPGDTTTLTAQVTGKSYTGLPSYEWFAESGTIVTANGISTQWVPPASTGIYHLWCRVTVDASVDTLDKYIMVRQFEKLDTGLRYSLFPYESEGILFIGTDLQLSDRRFYGFHVYKDNMDQKITTNDDPSVNGGLAFQFYPDQVLASCVTSAQDVYRQQAANIIFFPTEPGPGNSLVTNEFRGTLARKNQNIYPCGSEDGGMVVWQRHSVGLLDDGSRDSVNVAFRFGTSTANKQKILTRSLYTRRQVFGSETVTVYYFYRNIKPIFTPDESYIVYFCDSTEVFEPCLIPMEGVEPDTTQRVALMVDAQQGIFEQNGIDVSENTIFQWDPGSSGLLAFIDDNKRICFLDYAAHTAIKLEDVRSTEIAWGPNGLLAAVVDSGLVVGTAPAGADGRFVFRKERLSDLIIGVVWSPNTSNPAIAFRLVRKGKGSEESFSALVIYSMNEDRWYYASPAVSWATEPTIKDYSWMRVIFDGINEYGLWAPFSTRNPSGGGRVDIYHSY